MGLRGTPTQLDKARQSYQGGNLESTVDLLEPLVIEPPTDPRAMRLLFRAYADAHQIRRAESTYRALLDADMPESQLYALHLDIARVYHAGGQAVQSLEEIEKAIALNASIREAYDLLVQVHERQNSLMVAAETLQQGMTQQPDNVGPSDAMMV
jgi:predicted Zn-dependent protease